MYETIIASGITIVLSIVRWVFERKAAKKLSDQEFLDHIEAHQKKRKGAAAQATQFENNMKDLYEDLSKKDDNAS